MDGWRSEKRNNYRIAETNAGKIAVQFSIVNVGWIFYPERFGSVEEAKHFIDSKVERDLDSEVKKVIE